MAADLLDRLNPPQREAVVHTDGPLLILAGAGSGKTRVLTHRVAYLISEAGVPPYNILAVTFTNKAASEMKSRVSELVGRLGSYVLVSTFHSLCARILRQDIDALGYKKSFTILDESDQETAVKRCLKDLNLAGDMFKPRTVLEAISEAKNELMTPGDCMDAAADVRQRTIAQIYGAYQEALRHDSALDFDDLIMVAVQLLKERPDILERYQNRFKYIMVDEYQDTNHAQYILVKMLASKYRNLCVVGDDDQSIYEWRGADVRNILEFERDYPDSSVIKLEQNYRSTQTILDAANRVIANNRGRKDKSLWTSRESGAKISVYDADTEKDEARFIADEIQRVKADEGRRFGDFAVLYRTNAQSRVVEEVMLNRGIPYRIVGGLKFYERREIKDVMAYLRLIENPEDSLSLERIINVPRRGIGDSALALVRHTAQANGVSLYRAVALAAESSDTPARARKSFSDFVATMERLIALKGTATVTGMVQAIVETTGYLAELEKEATIESRSRIENLTELLTVTGEFETRQTAIAMAAQAAADAAGQAGLEDIGDMVAAGGTMVAAPAEPTDIGAFLEEVSLLTDLDRTDLASDSVTLMTLHSAKGLEFSVVFMAGMEENVFPLARAAYDPQALEEERRLCYVGITRAKDRLYLIHAMRRAIYGSLTANPISRFVSEIPSSLLVDARVERYAGARVPSGAVSASQRRAVANWERGAGASGAEYAAGDRVRHPKFGEGTVVSAVAAGGDWVLTIAFPSQGIKRLAQSFAPLERL